MIAFRKEMGVKMIEDVNFDRTIVIMVFNGIFFLSNFIVFLLIINLIAFHVWINYKGISTFEYIMKKRKLKEDRLKKMKSNKVYDAT
jgi:hypothetical protein